MGGNDGSGVEGSDGREGQPVATNRSEELQDRICRPGRSFPRGVTASLSCGGPAEVYESLARSRVRFSRGDDVCMQLVPDLAPPTISLPNLSSLNLTREGAGAFHLGASSVQ